MPLIKVLVVEDSRVVREFLVHILGSDPSIQVVGTVNDGEDALEAVRRTQPDVVTMDIHMPKLNGLEATRRIMETHPTPIVVVSGSADPRELATTFQAMEAGALAVLRRPAGLGHPDHEATAGELVRTVKLMSEVKVVRRWPRREAAIPRPQAAGLARPPRTVKVVAMGASTGGPPVLHAILAQLPAEFRDPDPGGSAHGRRFRPGVRRLAGTGVGPTRAGRDPRGAHPPWPCLPGPR